MASSKKLEAGASGTSFRVSSGVFRHDVGRRGGLRAGGGDGERRGWRVRLVLGLRGGAAPQHAAADAARARARPARLSQPTAAQGEYGNSTAVLETPETNLTAPSY